MKLPKKIAALLTVTLVASNSGNLGYADTTKAVSEDKLVGAGRWETAIEVSKKGWEKSDTAIIVNDSAIADALAATPFAEANDAPILLTGKDKLDERTNSELKRLGVKKVYLIGGEAVLSTNIETELKAQNIEIDRIQGQTRELTALEIAKRLDKIKDISEIAVVNGTTGLADAVSIAAVSAEKDMAIILSNSNEGTKASDEFIKKEDIKTSYVIGGPNSVSNEVASKLHNAKRIEGIDRNETNAKVIETFYTEKELKNAYITKNGMGKEDHLIDALAVGVLAAKNESPVIIVGNKLGQMQKDVTNSKSFKAITQVGGNGNEAAFGELKSMQGVTTYEVSTVKELNDALDKADANDVINVRNLNDNSRNSKIEIKSNKAIKINLYATSGKSVVLDAKSGTLIAHQTHTSIDIKSGELIINGKVSTVNVLEGGEATISNDGTSKPNVTVAQGASVEVAGKINTITVNGKDAAISLGKDSIVSKVEVSSGASGTVIDNAGKVDSVVSNAPNVSVENNGTVGNVSGTNKPTVEGKPVTPPSTGGGSSSGGSSSGGSTPKPQVTVTKIEIDNNPTQTVYTEGDKLDLTGLKVTLTKSDGTTEVVDFNTFETKGLTTSLANGTALTIQDESVVITHTESKISVILDITVNTNESTALVSSQDELKNALAKSEIQKIYVKGMIETTEQITINRDVDLIGFNNESGLIANKDFGADNETKFLIQIKEFNQQNGVNVNIKNLTLNSNNNAYGIQAYNLSKDIKVNLKDTNLLNSKGSGLTVNGSTVSAKNLKANGNKWQSVNVDNGSGVNNESVFVLEGDCNLNDQFQIKSDKGGVKVIAEGYKEYKIADTSRIIWINKKLENIVTIKSDAYETIYKTIQEAIKFANRDNEILIYEGTHVLDSKLLINKPITLKGIGEVILQPSNNFEGTDYLISIEKVTDLVKLENITVCNSKKSGINVFESSNVVLENVTSKNNSGTGLIVNSSRVSADNLNTSGNIWGYGVNVDNGSNPSGNAPKARFTLTGNGVLSEYVQIKSDKGDVEVIAEGYIHSEKDGKHYWCKSIN